MREESERLRPCFSLARRNECSEPFLLLLFLPRWPNKRFLLHSRVFTPKNQKPTLLASPFPLPAPAQLYFFFLPDADVIFSPFPCKRRHESPLITTTQRRSPINFPDEKREKSCYLRSSGSSLKTAKRRRWSCG